MEQLISKKKSLNCRGKLIELDRPVVMGILNLTPDSFFDGDFYNTESKIHRRIVTIIEEGAEIIDIGAYSSRPGAEHISEEEELNRLLPALKLIEKYFPEAIVSVDTFRSSIAKTVVEDFGVSIINDISGGSLDEKMFETVAALNVPYIMMHMRGTPQTMQTHVNYKDLPNEIIQYFANKVKTLRTAGVNDMIIDPGFGFSKTLEQNYELLKKLDLLQILELPVLVGISRKSMIYKFLDISPAEALNGTSVLHLFALQKGADILRVHDVKEAKETIKLFSLIK